MIKAFLSHTSVDKDLVGLVHKKLAANNAWYDAANIENGESIPEKINEGLRLIMCCFGAKMQRILPG